MQKIFRLLISGAALGIAVTAYAVDPPPPMKLEIVKPTAAPESTTTETSGQPDSSTTTGQDASKKTGNTSYQDGKSKKPDSGKQTPNAK
ncbi:MAG: hypothetical protein LBE24_09525 [Methylobacillus sp.]|jgi:hypothetical protein|nr:hypothetical protein [Methylobacillus sp.]